MRGRVSRGVGRSRGRGRARSRPVGQRFHFRPRARGPFGAVGRGKPSDGERRARRTDVAEHGPFLAPAAPSGSRSAGRDRGFGGGLGRGARRGGARVRPDERRGRLERANQPEVDALLRGGVARGLAVRAPPVQRPLADHAPLRTLRLAHENLTPGGRAPGRSPVGAGRRPRPLRHGAHGSRRNAAGGGTDGPRHLRPVPLLERCRVGTTSRRVTNPQIRPIENDVARAAHAGVVEELLFPAARAPSSAPPPLLRGSSISRGRLALRRALDARSSRGPCRRTVLGSRSRRSARSGRVRYCAVSSRPRRSAPGLVG